MKSQVKPPSEVFELVIEKLIYGGDGLGHHLGKVVFVPCSLPGDHLLVKIVESKKTYMRAEVLEVLRPGPGRQEPACPHFGKCGGCQLQHLDYASQLEGKRGILEEIFNHKFPYTGDMLIGMKASPKEFGYRDRARIQARGFGSNTSVGFYKAQSSEVVNIDECPLLNVPLNEALAEIKRMRVHADHDPGPQELEILCSGIEKRWQFAEVTTEIDDRRAPKAQSADRLNSRVPLRLHAGAFDYSVFPEVFFQANTSILADFVGLVRRLARDCGSRSALDLYCGVGLFTLDLARQFQNVTAVENSKLASRLCLQNAAAAGLSNIRVKRSDVTQWMRAVGSVAAPDFDLVVLDPPRTGAGNEVMRQLKEWAPENIIYVSCDPQTLCRDVALLPRSDYRIDHIEGFDLFPQTYHFETVLRLRRC